MYVWTNYVAHNLLSVLSLFIWDDYIGGSDFFIFLHYLFFHMKRNFMFLKHCKCIFSFGINEDPNWKEVTFIFKPSSILTWFESLKKNTYTAVFLNLRSGLSFRGAVYCSLEHM